VFKAEAPRLIAGLARIVRDVGIAEELSQDALVAALEQWPASGIPDNPGAWLMSAGKNRAINVLRCGKMLARRHEQLGHEIETAHALNASTLRRRSTPGLETIFRKRGVAIAASAIVSPLIQERATRSRAFPRSLRSKARVLGRSFPRSQQGRGEEEGRGTVHAVERKVSNGSGGNEDFFHSEPKFPVESRVPLPVNRK